MLLMGILMLLALVFSSDQLVNTVRGFLDNKFTLTQNPLIAPALTGGIINIMRANSRPKIGVPMPRLTSREKEVLELMAKGLMNRDIAQSLFVSEATVKNHVSSILRKLKANVRTEAVVAAIKSGLIS